MKRSRIQPRLSPEVEDLVGDPPGWLTRWGTVQVIGVLAAVVALATWLRYPDVLGAPVTILGVEPPVPVIARATGRLVELHVVDQEHVSLGQALAVIESSARPDDVRRLVGLLDAIDRQERLEDLADVKVPTDLQVGVMADELAVLRHALSAMSTFLATQTYSVRIAASAEKSRRLRALHRVLMGRREVANSASSLLEKQASRSQRALEGGVLSVLDAEQSLERALDRRALAYDAERARIENAIGVRDAEAATATLAQEFADRRAALVRDVRSSAMRLRALVTDWDRTFVLRAPTGGQVAFFDVWTANQVVREGKESLFVVPRAQEVVGRVESGQRGIGRVRPGMEVRVALDGYPAAQFGQLRARVDKLSATAREGGEQGATYAVTLVFPDGARTTYGRSVELRQGMTGRASIILEDLSLLDRFVFPIRQLLSGEGVTA